MKTKRLLPLLLVLVLLLALAVPAAASSEEAPAASEGETPLTTGALSSADSVPIGPLEGETPLTTGALSASEHVFDRADLLTDKEEAELRDLIVYVGGKRGCDYVILAEESIGGADLEQYANDFYDNNDFGEDGVLLLLVMDVREVWIATSGRAVDALSDLDPVFDYFLDDLSAGNYYDGFEGFVAASDYYMEHNAAGDKTSAMPVADVAGDRLTDRAGLLSETEAADLRAYLDSASRNRGCDYVIVTEQSIGNYGGVMAYADDFYDHNGFADDGVLLLLVMDVRDAWISTAGRAIHAIDADSVFDRFLDDVTDRDYYSGFRKFVSACDSDIAFCDAHDGKTAAEIPHAFSGGRLIGALAIGLLVTLIATGSMRSQLKSVRAQAAAADYVRSGSFSLNDSRDVFLYSTVTRVARPKESSSSSHGGGGSHFSSSGVSHGGGGRHF